MRPAFAVAGVELRRFLRDRSNIFFVFLFPLLLVLVIGSQFGSGAGAGRVTVAGEDSPLRAALVAELRDDGATASLAEPEEMRRELARGRTDVGLLLPDGAAAAFERGADVELEIIVGGQQGGAATAQEVRTAVAAVQGDRARLAALTDAGVPADAAREALAAAEEDHTAPALAVRGVDELSREFAGLGQFDLGAAGQTLLFVFLISCAGSSTLIQTRRLGVMSRTLAAPVSAAQALAGQALGRFAIAFFQGAYIMAVSALLFGVDWGNLLAALVVLAVFSVVAAGAAMVIGALVDNDGTAAGLGVGLGLVLAALGGSMLPLELFPDTLRTVAHVTPHAWAYDAFAEIQRRGGGVLDVLPELGVLVAMGAVLLGLGTWALRRSTARAM